MRTRSLLEVTLTSLVFSGCKSCRIQRPNFEDIGETGISVSPYDLTKIIGDEDGVKLLSNRLDIQFQDGTSTRDMQKALDGIGGTLIAYNEPLEFYAVEISPTDITGIKSSLQTLASESEVKYAEPIFVQPSTTSHTDNDDLYSDGGIMWAYEKIQLPEAHELAKNKIVNDVIVAVIDSGLTSAYTVVNVDDTEINLNSRTQYWYNFVDATTDVTDQNNDDNYGHGTKVAGIIAAKNGTGGINGVAYDAQVLPLNVFGNDEAGSAAVVQSAFADAVAYAATNPINADILNISLGFDEEAMASWYNYLNVFGDPDLIPKMEAAIEYAHNQGVIIIAAAGNDGTDSSQMFPARHQNVISVGATNDSDERADFSNYSEDSNIDYLGLAAPGEYVVTVDLDNTTSITSEQYFSGTSASVPLVSGLAALVLSVDDDYSHDEMFNLLRGNADIISISYPDNSSHNWFRINAYQTVADVLNESIDGEDTGTGGDDTGNGEDTKVFIEVSAGDHHSCGLYNDGEIVCWGSNTYIQSTPSSGTFTQVSVGYYHTCGLLSSGRVGCWGNDDYGESTPPSGTFMHVSAGGDHTCGLLSSGSVDCWGSDYYGQSTPPSGTFMQISAGLYFTCGLLDSGSVECWGHDYQGQSTPPAETFTEVSAGGEHACGLLSSNSVDCWGNNSYGQSTPPSGTFMHVSAKYLHTCGLLSSGRVDCWGNDDYGQSTPPSGTFTQVSAGVFHTCGLLSSGSVECWGNDNSGQSTPP